MKWLAFGLILAGIGNALYLPLHLIQPSGFTLPLAAGASLLGLFSLAAGIGTWTQRIYGWRMGFVTIFFGSIWCAWAAWESMLQGANPPSIVIPSVVAGIFLLFSLFLSGWWRDKRPWFEPVQKNRSEQVADTKPDNVTS